MDATTQGSYHAIQKIELFVPRKWWVAPSGIFLFYVVFIQHALEVAQQSKIRKKDDFLHAFAPVRSTCG